MTADTNSTKEKYLIAIVGPTAIGKTALSIKLAQHFKTEIISGDSRQFYKELQIGTAVPSEEELNAAKHHFIQHRSINNNYNVGDFEKDAISKINTLFKYYDVLIIVGGSGLYIDAIIKGLDDFPEVDKKIREDLNTQLENKGLSHLQNRLKELDPISYQNIAINNPHRVIRALEICIVTKKPYASFLNKEKRKRPFKTIFVGLTADRDVVYSRINKRVDNMMESGLLEEVKQLEPKKHLNALNTVGYKELFQYLEGTISLEFAVNEIKKHTRRFAKRQLTWFRKNEAILWFDYKTNTKKIIEFIQKNIS